MQGKLKEYGQLNSIQQARVKAIAEEYKTTGKISDISKSDLKAMGAEKLAEEALAKQAVPEGGIDVLMALGNKDAINKAKAQSDIKLKTAEEQALAQQLGEEGARAGKEGARGLQIKQEKEGLRFNPVNELGQTMRDTIEEETEQTIKVFDALIASYKDAQNKMQEAFERGRQEAAANR